MTDETKDIAAAAPPPAADKPSALPQEEVTRLTDDGPTRLPGRGPRIILCLEGEVEIETHHGETLLLTRGQSAFVPAADGALTGSGDATVVQADVP